MLQYLEPYFDRNIKVKSVTFLLERNKKFCCIILNKCVFNGRILAVSRRNVFLHGRWNPVLVGLCVLLQSHLSNQISSSETIQAKKYIEWQHQEMFVFLCQKGSQRKQLFTLFAKFIFCNYFTDLVQSVVKSCM